MDLPVVFLGYLWWCQHYHGARIPLGWGSEADYGYSQCNFGRGPPSEHSIAHSLKIWRNRRGTDVCMGVLSLKMKVKRKTSNYFHAQHFSSVHQEFIFSRYEPPHDKTNKMIRTPSEDSDQPGHPVWSVFAAHMKKPWVLSYLVFAGRTGHFVGFVMKWLIFSLLEAWHIFDFQIIEPRHEKTCFCHMWTTKL